MNKQDWYLDKLNITQYVLRKPNAIKGEAKVDIADHIRLIVVTKSPPNENIFQDILNAIHISHEDYLLLTPAQLIIPIEQLDRVIWFIDEPLPKSWQQSTIKDDRPIIITTSLSQLALSPNLKRQLWRTLCHYENYFTTN